MFRKTEFGTRNGKIQRSRKARCRERVTSTIFFRPHATRPRVRRSGVPRLGRQRKPSTPTLGQHIIRRRGQRRAHALRSSNGLDHPLISYSIVSLVNPYPSFYPTARLLSHTSHHARMRPQLIYRTSKHPLLTASWLGIPLSLPR